MFNKNMCTIKTSTVLLGNARYHHKHAKVTPILLFNSCISSGNLKQSLEINNSSSNFSLPANIYYEILKKSGFALYSNHENGINKVLMQRLYLRLLIRKIQSLFVLTTISISFVSEQKKF